MQRPSEFFTQSPSDATPAGAHSEGVLRYLTIVGCGFLALMLTLEPDVGFEAPLAARLLFWSLQIMTGLLVLQSVLYCSHANSALAVHPAGHWFCCLACSVLCCSRPSTG